MTRTFNKILKNERMPEEWRRSERCAELWQLQRNKPDNEVIGHTMKFLKRVVEARQKTEVSLCEQQYGFMPKQRTTDAILALRMLIEKYREGHRELHCVPL